MKPAAIYARVSTDRQKEEHTIASQTEALRAFASQRGFSVPDEWVFEDEGYMGATLLRPGLDKIRDLAAEGQIDAVLVHSPDRLSRKYISAADGGICAEQCRDAIYQSPASSNTGGSAAVAVARYDRRIRTSANLGTIPPRQKASRVAGCYQRSLWGSVRLPVNP
jgi:DNA invertase Pin-like site-specific DNA recombinase